MKKENINNGLISIIIPVYNVQNYIERCLDSILCQTYTQYEVLLVDDGSTDESGRICDDYVKKDSRIKVYHLKNGGVSRARNYALSQMNGDWFAFLDADDWIEPGYLEILLKNAMELNCEISACSFQRNTEYCIGTTGQEMVYTFESPDACVHNFICSNNSMQGMIWNKLYRTEKFADCSFDEKLKVNEDCMYTFEVMKKCTKASLTMLPLYHWFLRTDSACHSKKQTVDFSSAMVFLDLCEKTAVYADKEIEMTLKRNYCKEVLKVLINAEYDLKNEDIMCAKAKCRAMKKEIWNYLDRMSKLKYVLCFYFPRSLKLLKKVVTK